MLPISLRVASLVLGVVVVAACSSASGNGRVTNGINGTWGEGSGGPGIGPGDVLSRLPWDTLLNGHCPNPSFEFECPNGRACCPNGTQCCDGGANSGMCAPDCSTTYASNGCPPGYPTDCGAVCCSGSCDASGGACEGGSSSGGWSQIR